MNYYKLLKLNGLLKNPRIKLLGLYALHKLGKRYYGIYFDPVNACNLRCKMCYFSDKDFVKSTKGIFPKEDIENLGKAFFHRALKLQIGCGTEPTLYKHLNEVIREGKKYGIPYIAMTTNANLLEREKLEEWVKSGLDEITVSLHGVREETYTYFMSGGDYQRFLTSLSYVQEVKERYPHFKLRINYTFNEDNFEELNSFFDVFGHLDIDFLQIRPISKIGNSAYQNFSLEKIIPRYPALYRKMLEECKTRDITLLAHNPRQLVKRKSESGILKKYTYFYIAPVDIFRKDFNWKKENFDQYAERTGWGKDIWKSIFAPAKKLRESETENLNYTVT